MMKDERYAAKELCLKCLKPKGASVCFEHTRINFAIDADQASAIEIEENILDRATRFENHEMEDP
eukprot:4327397-Pyramimonas_sp.AAC.1